MLSFPGCVCQLELNTSIQPNLYPRILTGSCRGLIGSLTVCYFPVMRSLVDRWSFIFSFSNGSVSTDVFASTQTAEVFSAIYLPFHTSTDCLVLWSADFWVSSLVFFTWQMQLQRSANWSQQTMETIVHLFLKGIVGFYLCSFGLMFSLQSKLWYWWSRTRKQGQQISRETAFLLGVFICFLFNKTDLICKLFFAVVICFCFFKIFFLSTLSHMEYVSNVKSVRRMLSFLLVARKPSCGVLTSSCSSSIRYTGRQMLSVLMKMNSVSWSSQLRRQRLWASMSFSQILHNVTEQEVPITQHTS